MDLKHHVIRTLHFGKEYAPKGPQDLMPLLKAAGIRTPCFV